MLFALKACAEGKTVCILEESASLGGAWSLDKSRFYDKEIVHENACHLIEWYLGGYELLEELSGVKFVLCKPQPVKVKKSGVVVPYTTKKSIMIDYLLIGRSLIYGVIKLILSTFSFIYSRAEAINQIFSALDRLRFDMRNRVLGITDYRGIFLPEGGYSNFVLKLIEKIDSTGVTIQRYKVKKVMKNNSKNWTIHVENGETLQCLEVMVGQSSDLVKVSDNVTTPNRYSKYHHILISLPACDVLIRNSYVHFPDNKFFHRITFIEDISVDQINKKSIFLLQLRSAFKKDYDLLNELSRVNNFYRFALSFNGFELIKIIDSKYVSSTNDSGLCPYYSSDFFILRTIGDLSRNLVANKAFFSRLKDATK